MVGLFMCISTGGRKIKSMKDKDSDIKNACPICSVQLL